MIKVKKLPWVEHNANAPTFHPYQIFSPELTMSGKAEVIEWRYSTGRYSTGCKIIVAFDTIEQAQDYMQKLWDEYVISLLEVE